MKKLLAGAVLLLFCTQVAAAQGRRSHVFTAVANDVSISNIGSGIAYHLLTWNKTGTVTVCTVKVQQSVDGSSWSDLISGQDCSSNGQSTIVNVVANYIRLATTGTYTGSGSITAVWNGYVVDPAPGGGGITGTIADGEVAKGTAADTIGPVVGLTANVPNSDGFGTEAMLYAVGGTGTFGAPYSHARVVTGGPTGNYTAWTSMEADTNTHVRYFWDVYDGTNESTMSLNSLTGLVVSPSLNSRVHIYPTLVGGVSCPTTSICETAASGGVTSYNVIKPAVAAQGTLIQRLEAGPILTQSFSGDAVHSTSVVIGSGTSIGSTILCNQGFCPAGTYRVNAYVDITTACTVSGTYVVNLIYTDDQGAKTVPMNLSGTGTVPATGVITTTSTANFGQGAQILRLTSGHLNYSTTAVACGGGGPMVGNLYLSTEPVQ